MKKYYKKSYIFTLDELNEIIEKEESIAIYGAGEYGKVIADYFFSLNKQNKIETFLVTRKRENADTYRGIAVVEAEKYLKQEKRFVIIAVSLVHLYDVMDVVDKYENEYICVTEELYRNSKVILHTNFDKVVPFDKLHFMLAGFTKCGTTSLYSALKEMDDIYLSERKESALFRWYNQVEDPKVKLIKTSFNHIKEGQLVGMIEPTFATNAKQIFEFFGNELKIIFLVRNPVDAVFSKFKMLNRDGYAFEEMKRIYQSRGNAFTINVFDEFFDLKRNTPFAQIEKYIDCIEEFITYYSKEQIKVVIFEDMLAKPQETINSILQFIGSHCLYENEKLPLANEGNFVMADVEGLEIANRFNQMANQYVCPDGVIESDKQDFYREFSIARKQFEESEKIHNVKILKEQRTKLEAYYNESVRKLEKMLGRDLSKIWF